MNIKCYFPRMLDGAGGWIQENKYPKVPQLVRERGGGEDPGFLRQVQGNFLPYRS